MGVQYLGRTPVANEIAVSDFSTRSRDKQPQARARKDEGEDTMARSWASGNGGRDGAQMSLMQ